MGASCSLPNLREVSNLWALVARLAGLVGGRVALYGGIILLAGLGVVYAKFFSSSAVLKKVETKEAVLEATLRQEAEGLLDDYQRIDREPHQTGPELLAQLNASARRLREKP